MDEYIQQVIVPAAATETVKAECFLVIDKRCVIFLVEWTTASQILFVEILNSKLFCNQKCVFISELFFGFQNRFPVNLQN